jgi:hypothetical protein
MQLFVLSFLFLIFYHIFVFVTRSPGLSKRAGLIAGTVFFAAAKSTHGYRAALVREIS